MNKRMEDYIGDIKEYLKDRYNDDFFIVKAARRSQNDSPDIISAKCFSSRYPQENFDLIYHLSGGDILEKEKLIGILKEKDLYDEDAFAELDSKFKPYIGDNYTNILFQNEFAESVGLDSVLTKSWFETANYYPAPEDAVVSTDEYVNSEKYDLYVCTTVFLEDKPESDKDARVREVVDSLNREGIYEHYIYILFTDKNKEFLLKEYLDNYDNQVMYFRDAPYISERRSIRLLRGICG